MTKRYEVKRQTGSKQWGIYRDGELIEGGFFDRQRAEDVAQEYRDAARKHHA